MEENMKKKIVITLEEHTIGWIGSIYGQVGDKKTDKITTSSTHICYDTCKKDIAKADILDLIELWMEKIS